MNLKNVFLNLMAICFVIFISAQDKTDVRKQEQELGMVSWYRNYDRAMEVSLNTEKDVLILFQEVPGCATCRNYGHDVLSHPLMVEAIENLYVPLVIHNNNGGDDKKVLEKYGEPSWNNPVVRIVDAQGINITDRLSGNYSALGLIESMKASLKFRERNVPEYLNLLEQEFIAKDENLVEEKVFKMYCFWSGEKHLGSLEGVISTETGFAGGSEVVKVKYNDKKISEKELNLYAEKGNCEPISGETKFKVSKKDLKYNLKNTIYKYLPLTESQSTKMNSALATEIDPKIYLSPKQLIYLKEVLANEKDKEILFNLPFEEAWKKISL